MNSIYIFSLCSSNEDDKEQGSLTVVEEKREKETWEIINLAISYHISFILIFLNET
jgi:hypothetical protein